MLANISQTSVTAPLTCKLLQTVMPDFIYPRDFFHAQDAERQRGLCFVLMPFADEHRQVYDGVINSSPIARSSYDFLTYAPPTDGLFAEA